MTHVIFVSTIRYMANLQEIEAYFIQLQKEITQSLELLDGEATFQSDCWQRQEGGGGDTRVIKDGNIFEKGGVNFSHVHGKMPEFLKQEGRNAAWFHATGVSLVIHPSNPYVPIIHMNVRYFEMSEEENGAITDAWFGGGIDLSPAYPNEEDAYFFHTQLKGVCDTYDASYYPRFKQWCDDYFTIPHRKEMRGVSGIFFDHLRFENEDEQHKLFAFIQSVGNAFIPTYSTIVKRNKDKVFTEQHKHWQYIRRGRYAEFNLVYDRGTHFGLKTNGRIESILMSLPPHAEWVYDYHPEGGSEEATTLPFFQPRHWF